MFFISYLWYRYIFLKYVISEEIEILIA